MLPKALYIHIPFCLQRCRYCDFPSSVYSREMATAYLNALAEEFHQRAAKLAPETIYVGGGTPTSLTLPQLTMLMGLIKGCDLSRLREFTVEANPGTLTVDKTIILHDNGMTRLSIGAQTFCDQGLSKLGRIHKAKQIRAAVSICQEVGIDNYSLDLIYGWPGQTEAEWSKDLKKAVKLNPTHLSCYGLTYEKDTPLWYDYQAGRVTPVDIKTDREMFDLMGEYLPAQGYRRYEISSFARPGYESRHNSNYWIGGEYIGLGAGAHSFIGGVRSSNCRVPETYIRMITKTGSALNWEERLSPEYSARERLVVALRMRDGVDPAYFQQDTGFPLVELLGEELPPLLSDGWLEWQEGRLRLTEKALPVADSILSELVA